MRIGLVVVAALALAGCVTGERERNLRPGMNRQQVVSVMGAPSGDQVDGNFEALTWSNKLMSGWSWDRADYSAILVDGKVTQYGVGQVRQNRAPGGGAVFVIVPLH